MNDYKPCHYDGHCVFYNDEFNSCFNDSICAKREKLESKLLRKYSNVFHDKPNYIWQRFCDKIQREVCEMYPCKYNVQRNEVKRWIESQPHVDDPVVNLFEVFDL